MSKSLVAIAKLPDNYGNIIQDFNTHLEAAKVLLPTLQAESAAVRVFDATSLSEAEKKISEAKKARTSLENVRKQAKDPLTAIGKVIDGGAKEVNDALSSIETDLKTKVRHYEEELAQAKVAEQRKKIAMLIEAGMTVDAYGNFGVGNIIILASRFEAMTLEDVEKESVKVKAEVERLKAKAEADRLAKEEQERKDREALQAAQAKAKEEQYRAAKAEKEAEELRKKLAALEAAAPVEDVVPLATDDLDDLLSDAPAVAVDPVHVVDPIWESFDDPRIEDQARAGCVQDIITSIKQVEYFTAEESAEIVELIKANTQI